VGELHYLTYDPEAMWAQMHRTYLENGGDPLYPGDEKEMLLRGTMAILAQCYAAFDHAARMQTLRYAVGDYLDIIGEKRGIERIRAVKATGKAAMTFVRGTNNYIIAAGTLMTDGARTFETMESISVLPGSGSSVKEAIIQCTIAGTDGNGLPAGTELHLKEQDARVLSVVVSSPTAGGVDEEDNDAYRERIRQGGLLGATKSAYKTRAMETSANIVDAGAYKAGDGVVGIALILAKGLSSAEGNAIIACVKQAVNDDNFITLTDTVHVDLAQEAPYNLIINYQARNPTVEDVQTKLTAAVAEYQEWQENAVGRAFDPFRLLSLLYAAGATKAQLSESSTVNGGTKDNYTEITPNGRWKGTVTLVEI
jgi:phage-related baseplate assembly protein